MPLEAFFGLGFFFYFLYFLSVFFSSFLKVRNVDLKALCVYLRRIAFHFDHILF